jgi:hypothetical protein
VTLEPFIVQLSVSADTFRKTLLGAIEDARVVRELTGARVVVALPPGRQRTLRALPGVTGVTPDSLQHKLSPRTTAW